MNLFKSFLAMLITISMLADPIPAGTPSTSTIVDSHQPQHVVEPVIKYTDNWKIPQIDSINTKNQLLVSIKTSWNQLYNISSPIWQPTFHMNLLQSKFIYKTQNKLPLSKETSPFDLQTIQIWSIYKTNAFNKLDLFIAKSTSVARNVFEFLSESQTKSKQVEGLYINPNASSVLTDICQALKSTGHQFKSCYPKIETPHTTYKMVNVPTVSIDMEGVSENEIKQWNETRQDNHENCTLTLKTNTAPLKLSIWTNEDGTLHLRYYTKNKMGSKIGYCLKDSSSEADNTFFIEKLVEKSTFPTIGLLFYTPLFYSCNLWQIVWFIVLMDAFLEALVNMLEKNHLRESYWTIATFITLYCSCCMAFNNHISASYFPF